MAKEYLTSFRVELGTSDGVTVDEAGDYVSVVPEVFVPVTASVHQVASDAFMLSFAIPEEAWPTLPAASEPLQHVSETGSVTDLMGKATLSGSQEMSQDVDLATPQEMTRTISSEITRTIPQEMTRTIPQEMTRTIPQEMTRTIPQEMTRTIPQEMTRTIPQEMTRTIPQEMTRTIPRTMSQVMPRAIPPQAMPASIVTSGVASSQKPSSRPLVSTAPSKPRILRSWRDVATGVTNIPKSSPSQVKKAPAEGACSSQGVTNLGVGNAGAIVEEIPDGWLDVAHTTGTSLNVDGFFTVSDELSKLRPDMDENSLLQLIQKKVELTPGTTYQFRVAAINEFGRGGWSDVIAFQTPRPGVPGTPRTIKIQIFAGGALIKWQPAEDDPPNIPCEYSVYLSVRPRSKPPTKPGEMDLRKVYVGPSSHCFVPREILQTAALDISTSNPCIVFRIAAKNKYGCGTPTQVRWTLDPPKPVPEASKQTSAALKRASSASNVATENPTEGSAKCLKK